MFLIVYANIFLSNANSLHNLYDRSKHEYYSDDPVTWLKTVSCQQEVLHTIYT